MLLWLVYFVLRGLLHALAPSDRSDLEREAECWSSDIGS